MVRPFGQHVVCQNRDYDVMIRLNRQHVDCEHRYCGVMLRAPWQHIDCQMRYCRVMFRPTRQHGDCERCVILHLNAQHTQDCMQIYSYIHNTFMLCPTMQHVCLRDFEKRFCHLILRPQHNCQQRCECRLLCPTLQHIACVWDCKKRCCLVILCPSGQHVVCTKRYCVILGPTLRYNIWDCIRRCGIMYETLFYCCKCLQHVPHCRKRYCCCVMMHPTMQNLRNLRDCMQRYCANVYEQLL